ncbi:hypothetical protein Ddc_11163 [Ditylenchus destructor]|nr:hypothetical protein Ddc_11163 [Ditylenchus destructor]
MYSYSILYTFLLEMLLAGTIFQVGCAGAPRRLSRFDFDVTSTGVLGNDFETRSKKFYAPYQLSRYLATHPYNAKHFLPSSGDHLDEFIARHSNKRSKSPTPFDLASARFPNQVHSIHTRGLEPRGLDDMKNCYFSPVTCYLMEASRR